MKTEIKGPVKIDINEEKPVEGTKDINPAHVSSINVTIGGRSFDLVYNMRVQAQIEDELEIDFTEFNQKITKSKRCTKLVISALRILGNEGLRKAGEQPDLTDEWLMDHTQPVYTQTYRVAVIGAIAKGWFMESDNSYNEEQDETLNELRKKNETTG